MELHELLEKETRERESGPLGFAIHPERKQGNTKYYLLISVIVIATTLILAATLSVWKKEERFSSLYLVPGYNYYYPPNNIAHLTYGIENFEGKETQYQVKIFLENSLVKEDSLSLPENELIENAEVVQVPSATKLPAKITVQAKTKTETYEVFFWLKE